MSLFLPVLRLGEEGIASRVQPVVHNNGVLASITPLQPLGWPCSGRLLGKGLIHTATNAIKADRTDRSCRRY